MDLLKLKPNCSLYSSKFLKHILLLIFLPVGVFNISAQTKDRKWNLGLQGGYSIYSGDMGSNILDFSFDAIEQDPTIGLTLSRFIDNAFDISFMTTVGSWGYYPSKNVTAFKGTMYHANVNLKYKFNNGYLLPAENKLSPFILAGVGISNFSGARINAGNDFPFVAGLGLNWSLSEVLSVSFQSTFGFMGSAHYDPANPPADITGKDIFMLNMFGLNYNLGAGDDEDHDGVSDTKDKCSGTPANAKVDSKGCPIDTDGDGVFDYEDKCVNQVGLRATRGCPDIDKDGVADMDDACPADYGLPSNNGCPDTDGDGIIDNKDKCPGVRGTVAFEGCPDRDEDGVRDEEDLCPDVKGIPALKGCPDTDGDGIEDGKDMCPNAKGPQSTNGCPDTDNDGVHDGIDKCPSIAGSPAHAGCPDTDNDGVFDDIDKCPTVPGTPVSSGCPELQKETKQLFEKALQGIQFETGKAVIKPVSFSILNSIVKVMKDNPTYKLSIGGHTDNVGDDAMNMTLSKDRASAVANYLIKNGVDPMRVTANGYGETQPVDTNNTPAGRTRNRRVEFKVEFIQ